MNNNFSEIEHNTFRLKDLVFVLDDAFSTCVIYNGESLDVNRIVDNLDLVVRNIMIGMDVDGEIGFVVTIGNIDDEERA